MIGRLHAVVLDCPDAEVLAAFYGELTGLIRRPGSPSDWIILEGRDGEPRLCLQAVTGYRPPRWPDPAFPQQIHLDIDVDDIRVAEPRALAMGARLLQDGGGRGAGFRVYADPAGHPFCLVWGQD